MFKTKVLVLSFLLSIASSIQAADTPFEAEIKAFEESDKKQPPEPGGILFVGSSSIRMWTTLKEDFPGKSVINRGFGGSQIADSIHYAPRIILPYKPKTIVLYAGDNDIAGGKSPAQVLEDYKTFVATVRKDLPETRIVYISIKASLARWSMADKIQEANSLISKFAVADKAQGFVDVFAPMLGEDGKPRADLLIDDGLHLSKKGYELWTKLVGEELKH